MAPEGPSNIRVFVHWRDQTVFAGEDIKCTITFKNVARESDNGRGPQSHNTGSQQRRNNSDRQRLLSSLASPLGGSRSSRGSASITSPPPASNGRGHRRSALSLSIPPSTPTNSRSAAVQWPSSGGSFSESRPGHAHKRSLSIVSIGSASTIDDHNQRGEAAGRPLVPQRGHNRASSLQILSRGGSPAGPQTCELLLGWICLLLQTDRASAFCFPEYDITSLYCFLPPR